MDCRNVLLAKKLLGPSSNSPQLAMSLADEANDSPEKIFKPSLIQWAMGSLQVKPGSITYAWVKLYGPCSFEKTTTVVNPY